MLHPVSSRVLELPAYSFSLITILGLSAIAISDLILAIDVTLDRSKAYISILISTHLLYFGWIILMNSDARRQKSQVLRPCFDLVNYSLSSVSGLLVSLSLV